MAWLLGVDIGGTKCAVILGRQSGDDRIEKMERISFPTEVSRGPDHALSRICEGVESCLQKHNLSASDISGAGISCGGPLDSRRGLILSPPNLLGWDGIPIVALLERRFGIPTRLQNDANACALAEWRFGAARGCRNVIFLTFGTGLGAGLILDGRLYSGTNDMAGEAGHIRLSSHGPVGYGKAGSFEGFCSGGGIAQLARIRVLERLQMGEKVSFCPDPGAISVLDAKRVAEAAASGDELAREILAESGAHLGRGLSILIDLLNPECIVIGSIFARSRQWLWPAARDILEKEALQRAAAVCRIIPAELGEEIGDFAALAVALE